MPPSALDSITVEQLVRSDLRMVAVLADLGISPRYLQWSVRSAAEQCGVNLDRLTYRLARIRQQVPGRRVSRSR